MVEITTIRTDLTKNVSQAHGVDASGIVVVRKAMRLAEVLSFFKALPRYLVGMEACATSHYWAREFAMAGDGARALPLGGPAGSIVRSTATFVIVSIVMFLGGTAHAIPPGSKPTFAVLGPLFINSPQEFTAFDTMLTEAKNIGVQAVSIDVWWGVVQPASANSFDWSYYDNVFSRIRTKGLRIIPILSFHPRFGG